MGNLQIMYFDSRISKCYRSRVSSMLHTITLMTPKKTRAWPRRLAAWLDCHEYQLGPVRTYGLTWWNLTYKGNSACQRRVVPFLDHRCNWKGVQSCALLLRAPPGADFQSEGFESVLLDWAREGAAEREAVYMYIYIYIYICIYRCIYICV